MKDKKGFTLPDVILILITMALIVVAGMDFYASLLYRQGEVHQQVTAINLAIAQIEDLTAVSIAYDDASLDLLPTQHDTTLAAGDIPAGYEVYYSIGAETRNIPPTGTPISVMYYKTILVTVLQPQIGTMARRHVHLSGYKIQ